MAERAGTAAPPSPASPPYAPTGSDRASRGRAPRAAFGHRSTQTIASLATELQLHPNTVRFHLDSLVAAGRVRQADHGPRRRGRPALLYEAVRGMDPGGPRDFGTLAEILTDGIAALPDPQALAQDAGRRWGRAAGDGHAPAARSWTAWSAAGRAGFRARTAGRRRRDADRPAALPVSRACRGARPGRLPHPPRPDAGRYRGLGRAPHGHPARALRRA